MTRPLGDLLKLSNRNDKNQVDYSKKNDCYLPPFNRDAVNYFFLVIPAPQAPLE